MNININQVKLKVIIALIVLLIKEVNCTQINNEYPYNNNSSNEQDIIILESSDSNSYFIESVTNPEITQEITQEVNAGIIPQGTKRRYDEWVSIYTTDSSNNIATNNNSNKRIEPIYIELSVEEKRNVNIYIKDMCEAVEYINNNIRRDHPLIISTLDKLKNEADENTKIKHMMILTLKIIFDKDNDLLVELFSKTDRSTCYFIFAKIIENKKNYIEWVKKVLNIVDEVSKRNRDLSYLIISALMSTNYKNEIFNILTNKQKDIYIENESLKYRNNETLYSLLKEHEEIRILKDYKTTDIDFDIEKLKQIKENILSLLKEISHENIVYLIETIMQRGKMFNEVILNLLFEIIIENDLQRKFLNIFKNPSITNPFIKNLNKRNLNKFVSFMDPNILPNTIFGLSNPLILNNVIEKLNVVYLNWIFKNNSYELESYFPKKNIKKIPAIFSMLEKISIRATNMFMAIYKKEILEIIVSNQTDIKFLYLVLIKLEKDIFIDIIQMLDINYLNSIILVKEKNTYVDKNLKNYIDFINYLFNNITEAQMKTLLLLNLENINHILYFLNIKALYRIIYLKDKEFLNKVICALKKDGADSFFYKISVKTFSDMLCSLEKSALEVITIVMIQNEKDTNIIARNLSTEACMHMIQKLDPETLSKFITILNTPSLENFICSKYKDPSIIYKMLSNLKKEALTNIIYRMDIDIFNDLIDNISDFSIIITILSKMSANMLNKFFKILNPLVFKKVIDLLPEDYVEVKLKLRLKNCTIEKLITLLEK